MSSKAILDRVAALIARAASPEKEEARTSAYLACEMIRRHGLILAFEEDGAFTTRPTTPPQPSRRKHKSVVVFRCGHCGRQVPKAGPCQACIDLRSAIGVWTVDCQGCGRSTPPGRTEPEVNSIAFDLGFRIADDGRTLCPMCFAYRRPA
jgi:hypothetical protein